MSEKYSVLMSVYYKEKAEYLRESMQSIYDQTIPVDDFVLICDGPLTNELDNVIEEMQEMFGDRLNVYRLEKNVGLGNALNVGIQLCKNELIARMDSDDVSKNFRCAEQLEKFGENPELSIVGAAIEEFERTPDELGNKRILPEYHEQIVEFAKKRNPFNHPCVMYKKSAVMQAGGYQDFYLLEDYYLWVRMLLQGMKGYNIQKTLLFMRTGNGLYSRRSGIKYAVSQKRLFQYMHQNGIVSAWEYIFSVIIRCGISVVPNFIRKIIYQLFLREKS